MKTFLTRRPTIYLMIIAITVISCSNNSGLEFDTPESVTHTPSSPSGERNTAAAELQATATPTLTPVSLVPSPSPPYEATVFSDHFFFEGLSPDCQLPCWNHLLVGMSAQSLEKELNRILGTDRDLFEQSSFLLPDKDLLLITNDWEFGDEGGFSFWVDVDTRQQVLLSYAFLWDSRRYGEDITIASLMQRFGQPLLLSAALNRTQTEGQGLLQFVLIYESGLNVDYEYRVELSEDETALFCLNQIADRGSIRITERYRVGLESLDPIQQQFLNNKVTFNKLQTMQELFGVDSGELYEQALAGGDVCYRARVQAP